MTNKQDLPPQATEILGAVARGWCHPANQNKTFDPDLAIAIAAEVSALEATPPTTSPPLDPWHQAVLDQCMLIEGGYVDSDPTKTVAALIDWHILNERRSTASPGGEREATLADLMRQAVANPGVATAEEVMQEAIRGANLPIATTQAAEQREPLTKEQRRYIIDESGDATDGLTQGEFADEIILRTEAAHGIGVKGADQ